MTENYIDQYFALAADVLGQVARESGAGMRQAAEAVATAVEQGGMLLLFGSGHSALVAKDAAYRAGGLSPALAIDDVADGDLERIEGVAKYLVSRYTLTAGSVLIIISNSGINPVPIEMALLAKAGNITSVAITSVTHSQSVPARHSSGKKLYEVADITIDTHNARGDAAIQLPGLPFKSGAMSTMIGTAIVQAITVQAAGLLIERGIEPPLWVSANIPEGDTHNNKLLARYRPQIARYQMATLPEFIRKAGDK
jgi:uncharacterized phosphosugar-binding protein